MPIKILPEEMINLIAAGEVIERPFSVVKELVENSLDAGAGKISVWIEEGGKKRIKVTDNGSGMGRTDAVICFERHATSKLLDLYCIESFGFRGEALSSIAAVSKLCLKTSDNDTGSGTEINIEGGKFLSVLDTAFMRGTSFDAAYLFFNQPARRRFLKADRTEFKHIHNYMLKQAVSAPSVHFKFYSNDELIFDVSPQPDTHGRISQLYGNGFLKDYIYIEDVNSSASIHGYVSLPGKTASGVQELFINGRSVVSNTVSKAVSDGCGGRSDYFIFLEIDPKQIDVNVHPAKKEVRFFNSGDIFSFVRHAVLKRQETHKKEFFDFAENRTNEPVINYNEKEEEHEPSLFIPPETAGYLLAGEPDISPYEETKTFNETPFKKDKIEDVRLSGTKIKPLGQINETFLIADIEGKGLFIIDQHTAHERILFEELSACLNTRLAKQPLLFPVAIPVPPDKMDTILSFSEDFDDIGIEIEQFGGNSIIVRALPALIKPGDIKKMLSELFDAVLTRNIVPDKTEFMKDIIAVMACHGAVRAGQALEQAEIVSLLNRLARTSSPFKCPHGRPVIIKFSYEELEKMFNRR